MKGKRKTGESTSELHKTTRQLCQSISGAYVWGVMLGSEPVCCCLFVAVFHSFQFFYNCTHIQHLQIKGGMVQLRWETWRFIIRRLNPGQSQFSLLPPWRTITFFVPTFLVVVWPHVMSVTTSVFIVLKHFPFFLFCFFSMAGSTPVRLGHTTECVSAKLSCPK